MVSVMSHDKESLVGATVYFESLDIGAVTDFEGVVVFRQLPEGIHEVTVSFLGYELQKRSISIPEIKEIEFILEESDHHLEEVILQSTRSTRTI